MSEVKRYEAYDDEKTTSIRAVLNHDPLLSEGSKKSELLVIHQNDAQVGSIIPILATDGENTAGGTAEIVEKHVSYHASAIASKVRNHQNYRNNFDDIFGSSTN